MAKDTLYIKIDQNVMVHSTQVVLGDIAQVKCSNQDIENRAKVLKIPNATKNIPGRHVMSIMAVIGVIQKEFPAVDVNNIGETDFIITYEKTKQPGTAVAWIKTICVCMLSFFGAAFTIMTFNNDADIPGLFAQLYNQFTGLQSDGFTILELTYSIGLGLGILIFFNHFAGKKLTADPTPMEVEMRLYEDDVNNTLIESSNRQPSKEKNSK